MINHQVLRFRRYLRSPKSRWLVIQVIGPQLLALALAVHFHLIFLDTSPSIDEGLYVRDFTPITKNSKIAFCPPQSAIDYLNTWVEATPWVPEGCQNGHEPFLKKVAAIPGDRVTLTDKGISVNGEPIIPGTAPLRWTRGSILKGPDVIHRMPLIDRKTYIVPPGQVWAYTPQWYGLDSRYYGTITPLVAVKPLWTISVGNHPTMPRSIAKLQNEQGK